MAPPPSGLVGEEINLDTSKSDRALWLVKVPKIVSEVWKKVEPNDQVGFVRMCFDPLKGTGHPSTNFTLRLSGSGVSEGFPLEFNLNKASEFVPMHIFSETAQGKLTVEGRIDQKFDMQAMADDSLYRNFLRSRESNANKPKRQVKLMESGQSGMGTTPLPGLFTQNKEKATAAFKAMTQQRQVSMNKDELEALVFKLFEQQEYWSIKHLNAATKQPQVLLKRVLTDLCVYNKRGPHLGMYELKEEYKGEKPSDE